MPTRPPEPDDPADPPDTADPPPAHSARGGRAAVADVLQQALSAHRAGTLEALLRERRRAAHWYGRRLLAIIDGTRGEAPPSGEVAAASVALLLRWAAGELRPDRRRADAPVDRADWLDRPSWRPALSVLCHYGFTPVPAFPDRYRRTSQESAADSLCGLWNVGPSSYYRYLDKGKRLMVEALLRLAGRGDRRGALREAVVQAEAARGGWTDDNGRRDWHRRGARLATARGDACAAVWHLLQAGELAEALALLHRRHGELAAEVECDDLLARSAALATAPPQQVALSLAAAAVHRARGDDERERVTLEQATAAAHAAGDPLLMGRATLALARHHEMRDADRSRSCLEESVRLLQRAHEGDEGTGRARDDLATALVLLAWSHVMRNDPRARVLLDRARDLPRAPAWPDDLEARCQQAWAEYWRRAGQPRSALDHLLRALNLVQRLGDRRQLLTVYNNLCIAYGELREFDRAIEYGQRILDLAHQGTVESYILVATRINLGAAYFWQGRLEDAIDSNRAALDAARRDDQRVNAQRAMFNLAECHYQRFQRDGDPQDEAAGDAWAQRVLQAPASEGDSFVHEATRTLKVDLLGPGEGTVHQRLVPEEYVEHWPEMAEVQRQRALLALPAPAAQHAAARLAIARAYAAIAAQERERALELLQSAEASASFADELAALQRTFERPLTRERRLVAQWDAAMAGAWQGGRPAEVLAHLLSEGWIGKSGYARVCGVGLATASKHLGLLAARGLLRQTGRGPGTRYLLPEDVAA